MRIEDGSRRNYAKLHLENVGLKMYYSTPYSGDIHRLMRGVPWVRRTDYVLYGSGKIVIAKRKQQVSSSLGE